MNNKILKILSYLLVAASFIFVIKTLIGMNISQIGVIITPARLLILMIMCFVYSLNTFFYAFAWKKLLLIFSKQKISSRKIINLYLKSNIAKYLPGNVFHFAGRHILVKENNVSHTHMLLSNLAEIVLLVFTAMLIVLAAVLFGLITIPDKIVSLISLKYIILAFIIIFIVSLIVIVILIRKKQFSRLKSIIEIISFQNLKEIILSMLLYSTMFIITGFILFIIFYMLKSYNLSFQLLYQIIFVFTLSWVLGYIVPGAPGGVGIREAVIIIMLSPILDSQTAALGALVLRVVTIAGDIISFMISNHHYFNNPKTEENSNE